MQIKCFKVHNCVSYVLFWHTKVVSYILLTITFLNNNEIPDVQNYKQRSTFVLPLFTCCWTLRGLGRLPCSDIRVELNSETMNPFTGLLGRGISTTQGLYLHRIQHGKRWHTSMTRGEFEPTTLLFERSKTKRALDYAAIGTGPRLSTIKSDRSLTVQQKCHTSRR
jgi:hypothetical protein